MPNSNDRFVFSRPDEAWTNQRINGARLASVHQTQAEAMKAARQNLVNADAGELNVQRPNRCMRGSDTIGGGNDPCPPKDTEH